MFVRGGAGGTFTSRQAFEAQSEGVPEVAIHLDYDSDGDLDIVSASGTRVVDLLLNNGSGLFDRMLLCENGALSGHPLALEAADLDGSGSPDIAVLTYQDAGHGTVELLYNLEWRPSGVRIDPVSDLPADSPRLDANYPNPFNPATTIVYHLPVASRAVLSVFDMLGRRVAVLESGRKNAGRHEVSFDASGLPSGVYFYRLVAGDHVSTNRMVLVK